MTKEGGCEGLFFKLEACDQPQGSVLGLLLFVIYINDLDENLGGMVRKFANDTKVGGIVESEVGYLGVQRDLDQLGQWAGLWVLVRYCV